MLTEWLRRQLHSLDRVPATQAEVSVIVTTVGLGCDRTLGLADQLPELGQKEEEAVDEVTEATEVSGILTELRIISLAEVGEHSDPDDAWMVIYDKVFCQASYTFNTIYLRFLSFFCV